MPTTEFEQQAELLGLEIVRPRSRHAIFNSSGAAFSVLRAGVEGISSHAERLASAEVGEALRKQLLDGIFGTLNESQSLRCDLTQLTYTDIVKRSQELALSDPETPTTVLELCTELRVCRRTLQKSFLYVMGQSPSTYLRYIRLGGVRRLLRSTLANRMTVADAAARWGFVHLGRFANDYRRLFGELPSQTSRPDAEF
jgi:transcriptional regulator GlxA family with amidase domain